MAGSSTKARGGAARSPDRPSFAGAAPKPVWARRWAVVRASLLFCAGLTLQSVVFGPDDRLRESALLGLLALSGSVVLGYLGFATQDDRNWLRSFVEAQTQEKRR